MLKDRTALDPLTDRSKLISDSGVSQLGIKDVLGDQFVSAQSFLVKAGNPEVQHFGTWEVPVEVRYVALLAYFQDGTETDGKESWCQVFDLDSGTPTVWVERKGFGKRGAKP